MSANNKPALSRRSFLISAGLAAAFPGLAGASVTASSRGQREDLELWLDRRGMARLEGTALLG